MSQAFLHDTLALVHLRLSCESFTHRLGLLGRQLGKIGSLFPLSLKSGQLQLLLGGLLSEHFLVLAHADQFFDKSFQHVVAVLKFQTAHFLKIGDLNHVGVLFYLKGALLLLKELATLLDDHVLLTCDQVVFV